MEELNPKKETDMEKVIVTIDWCEKNYCGGYGDNVPGAAVFTASTFEEAKREAQDTLDFHMEGYIEHGEEVPQWYLDKDYELEFRLTTAALLQSFEADVPLSAVSRATGINQRLLSHYANGLKVPREQQRLRIIDGLHSIGRRLLAV